MSEEIQKVSVMDKVKSNQRYQKLPARVKQWFEGKNIDEVEMVINYLCIAASHFLSKNDVQAAMNMLEFAEELAIENADQHLSAEIGAWLGLIEFGDDQLIQETQETIKEIIKEVAGDQKFHKTLTLNKD